MHEITPIPESPEDFEEVEKEIRKFFIKELYVPLLEEMGETKQILRNSLEDIVDAINSGRIVFHRGNFTGRFTAQISKSLKQIGARWKGGKWNIPSKELPPDIRTAVSTSQDRFERTLGRIDERLAKVAPREMAERLSLEDAFDKTLWKLDKKVEKSLKGVTIAPKFTKEQARVISRDYTNNMKLYIQEWTQKEIVSLREKMKKHIEGGGRYEDVIKTIQRSYGVSANKAKFLARQETSLLMTKFKEVRYTDAGIRQYKWRTVIGTPAHPVRPMHKALNGKIFSWDAPPVTSPNGARNNPGQDFGCRCVAIPIVKF